MVTGIASYGGTPQGNGFVVVTENGRLIRFNTDLTSRWMVETPALDPFPPVVADLDRDGEEEIILVSPRGRVDLYDSAGMPKADFTFQSTGRLLSPPAVADLDGDGFLDIIVQDETGVLAVHHSGARLNHFPLTTDTAATQFPKAQPLVVDLDGDGTLEILAVGGNGLVYALRPDGRPVPSFPLVAGSAIRSTPTLADLDGDGDLDLIAASDDGHINVWDLPYPYRPDRIIWGQPQLNADRSGRLVDLVTEPAAPGPTLLVRESVYNYPNPTEGDYTTIRCEVSAAADIRIQIYDQTGVLVDRLEMRAVPQVPTEVVWRLDRVASGVYLARVEARGLDGRRDQARCLIAVVK